MTTPDLISAALKAVCFVLLFWGAGTAIFVAAFGNRMPKSLTDTKRLGAIAAWTALACSIGQYSLEAARMAGDFSGVLDRSLQALVMSSSSGASFALRAAGLVLVAFSLRRASAAWRVSGLIGVLSIAAAFAVTGHTSVHARHSVLAVALFCHVLVGMFWFGALPALWVVSRRERPEEAGAMVAGFSTVAVVVVPLILVAGLVMTAILVPGLSTFAQPYGQMLIAKLGLLVVLLLLAAANKWRFGPRIASSSAAAFRKVVGAEFVLLCAVLAVTAFLTAFFSPE